ncbi:Multiple epidermal growth factor-like domains protein 8 [Linnemannia zychae]|nr:Multiple epidermal growth factor-like domains protein 8 [Linnemannia zychae]
MPSSDHGNFINNNSLAIVRGAKLASQLCSEERPQKLSASNGTFSSNSGDGDDPIGARTCTWNIAIPEDGTSTTAPSIIKLTFWTSVQLACGPIADVWMYDSKTWVEHKAINPDKIPTGKVGAACVFIASSNRTQMAVFGGWGKDGLTMRELHFYDILTREWSVAAQQNSVGLSGASGVYHEATNSLYFFGGMINQTIRNTVPYQYSLDQEKWFALAPRFDPLASRAVGWNGTMYIPTSEDGVDNNLDDPKGDGSYNSTTANFQDLAMYDTISGVWAPVGLMGDTVVMYGGMRPFGLGTTKDPSCFIKTMYLYDLSCQKWSSYGIADANDNVRTRVNHTMVLRPPGATGGDKASYTAYVFGGFDGSERNDIINVTLHIYPTAAADVNRCRALTWCSKYDDCQSCNSRYCSYVNGLCLFDTDKAKKPASSDAPYLLGGSNDIPTNGTLQGLLSKRPDLESQVVQPGSCPYLFPLDILTLYPSIIEAGNTLYFKTYIDAPNLDIQFEITTRPNEALHFRSLNVWEGFMNMYWRASHALTDNTWDETQGISTLRPDDLPAIHNSSDWDPPVITPSGTLNVAELMRRWEKYSGLDGSPSHSALQGLSTQGIYFLAEDPRRFSGYYVYSLHNPTTIPITMTLKVNLLNRPEEKEPNKGPQLDLATLGFFMVGFILGVLLLILVGRKLRRVIAERDEAQWAAAEQRMLEEEAAEEERRAALGLQGNSDQVGHRGGIDGDDVEKKPMYRIVVGVQQEKEALLRGLTPSGSTISTLRHRPKRKSEPSPLSRSGSISLPFVSPTELVPQVDSESLQGGRRKSDFIHDLGSLPPCSDRRNRLSGVLSKTYEEQYTKELQRRHTSSEKTRTEANSKPLSGLQRGLSLGRLKGSNSLKRFLDNSRIQPEEKEGLTRTSQDAIEDSPGDVFSGSESEQSPFSNLPHTSKGRDSSYPKNQFPRRQRNPIMVQPISIEPLPFHGGLVPNTRKNYRRYRRSLQRRQQQDQDVLQQQQQQQQQNQRNQQARTSVSRAGSSRRPSFSVARSFSRRHGLQSNLSKRSQSSLREAHLAASRTALRSTGGSPTSGNMMEMMPLRSFSYDSDGRYQNEINGRKLTAAVPGANETEQDIVNGSDSSVHEKTSSKSPQEYEPGPLLAINVLIVFPGDVGTRAVMNTIPDDYDDDPKDETSNYGKKAMWSVDEEEDRRSQNTLYNSNITIEGTNSPHGNGGNNNRGHISQGSSATCTSLSTRATKTVEDIDAEQRLPPMAIGTVFVPDPVRWWAYKAHQQVERRRIRRELGRIWARQRQQQLLQQQQQHSKWDESK